MRNTIKTHPPQRSQRTNWVSRS